MMAEDDIIEFIRQKEKFVDQDYKFRYWTEITFYSSQKIVYDERLLLFEKKLISGFDPIKMKKFLNTSPFKRATRDGLKLYHLANLSGFIASENAHLITESAIVNPTEKSQNFLTAFEKIILDTELVPAKTVIVLSSEKHHMERVKRKSLASNTPNSKKRKLNAVRSKKITDFFAKTKSPTMSENENKKKTDCLPLLKYRLEELIYEHRKGEDIQILWIPENHSELDPAFMASIQFCSEVIRLMSDNEEISDKIAMSEMLNIFPNLVWTKIFEQVQEFEEIYKKRNCCENESKNSLESDDGDDEEEEEEQIDKDYDEDEADEY